MRNSVAIVLIRLTIPILLLGSCVHSPPYNLEPHLGLYKVIDAKCYASPGIIDRCPDIRFIELVKGTFYGITPQEVAFVLWRQCGEDGDIELCYEADKIGQLRKEGSRLYRTVGRNMPTTLDETMYFTIVKNRVTGYRFTLTTQNRIGEMFHRDFQYALRPTTHKETVPYRLVYPSND